MKQAKIAEFTNLQQRNLSIAEHICTFDQLARFAPSLVSTEKSRIHHFMEGSKPEIARDVEMGINGPATYAMVIEKALRAEHHKKKISVTSITRPATGEPSTKPSFRPEKEKIHYPPIQGRKGPFHQAQGSRKQGNKRKGQFDQQQTTQTHKPIYPKCGRTHFGECLHGKGVCYNCGKPGHMEKDCRAKSPNQQQESYNNKEDNKECQQEFLH